MKPAFGRFISVLLAASALAAAGSCADSSPHELGVSPDSPLASPTMRTYNTALVMHMDSGGDVWVAAPARATKGGPGRAQGSVQAFLAFSRDGKVQWRLGIPIGRFDAIEDLRSSGLPSVTAPPGRLMEAIAASKRGADVVVLTGLEGPALNDIRSGVVGALLPGWRLATSGRAAWRSSLNLTERE